MTEGEKCGYGPTLVYTNAYNDGKSVEILNIRGNNWFDGPDMPFSSEETMVGLLANSLEGEVAWVFGGTNLDASAMSDAIFRGIYPTIEMTRKVGTKGKYIQYSDLGFLRLRGFKKKSAAI